MSENFVVNKSPYPTIYFDFLKVGKKHSYIVCIFLSLATCGGKRAKQDPYKYRNQAYSSIEFANKALRGHMLKRKTAQSLIDCIHKCMERKRECLSFNIGHTNITNRYICELNKVSRKYYPHNVVDEHGYYYYDVYWV